MSGAPPPGPPPPPGTTAAPTKRVWATVEAEKAIADSLDLSAPDVRAAPDIARLDWATLTGIKRAEGLGVCPVVFARVSSGVVVLKAGGGVGQEYFASLVAESFGALVPKIRLVQTSCEEFQDVVKAVQVNVPKGDALEFTTKFSRFAALMVIEYVKTIADATVLSPQAMDDVGALVVLDLIFYSVDRFPLYSQIFEADDAAYNLGNLIVREDGRVLGIDQGPKHLDAEKYKVRLEELVQGFKASGTSSELVTMVVDEMRSEMPIPSDAAVLLASGISKSLDRMLAVDLVSKLRESKVMCAAALGEANASGFAAVAVTAMLRDINVEQMETAVETVRGIMES